MNKQRICGLAAATPAAGAACQLRQRREHPQRHGQLLLPHRTDAPAVGTSPSSLDPAQFSPDVTNPWFPLEPGTQWTYREVNEDGEVLQVVVTASTETRMIANGVEARIVRDTVTLDGEIIEDTLDWYAQDEVGTVWYLGEDTAEFEDGYIASHEGSFEAGVDGAQAGVIMPADPTVGQVYRQEYYAGVAEDNGAVLATRRYGDRPRRVVRRSRADRRYQCARTRRSRAQVLRQWCRHSTHRRPRERRS